MEKLNTTATMKNYNCSYTYVDATLSTRLLTKNNKDTKPPGNTEFKLELKIYEKISDN